MANCYCCDQSGGWADVPQPEGGFNMSGPCEPVVKKYLPVAPNVDIECNQALFWNNAGNLVVTDTDFTRFAGFSARSKTDTDTQTKIPVWVMGTFDQDQAVFATLTTITPAMREEMAKKNIYLVKGA